VTIVIKSKVSMSGMGAQSNESRQDATGTVIDPSGLTVLSLSATDPAGLIQNMLEDNDRGIKMETEVGDIKILLEDGSELPAEIVLRDRDLDLAFIRPKTKPAAPMAALDFSQSSKAEVLDQVVTLNRLGMAAGRAYSASVERISSVVQRPRLFYIPDSTMTTTTLGSPAFTMDGKVLGLFVMRSVKGRSGGNPFSAQANNLASIILPADTIQKAAQQAPAVGEAKKETPETKEEKKQE
jgi:S1-C subfamily serine protease